MGTANTPQRRRRPLLVAWKLEAAHAQPHELVIGTADGKHVAAQLTGHADPEFTLRVYARDSRDEEG